MRAALIAAAALAILAAPAGAERAIIGLPSPAPNSGGFSCPSPGCTRIQTALPSGLNVTPPGDGRIDAWWAVGHGSANLRIVHTVIDNGMPTFRALAGSSTHPLNESVVNFPTDLPAHPGDLIGVTETDDTHDFVEIVDDANANANRFAGAFPDETNQDFNSQAAVILKVGAEFVYTPVLTGLSVTSGSTAGGESVVITGNHLTESTSVRFGSTPAASFHIDSNTQITAVVPAASPGTTDVTVSGPGGTTTIQSADRYTFIAPQATVSPATIDFGTVGVGAASAPQAVTLSNTGTVPASVASAALSGDTGDFTKLSDSCSGHTVAPGGTCSIPLVFAPGSPGPHRATLLLDDNASDAPQNVVLVGTTVAGGGPPGAQTPSNAFTVGKLKRLKLPVTVASNGTVTLTRTRLVGAASATGGPGTLVLRLRLSKTARKTLKRAHRLKLKAKLTFAPAGGTPAAKTVKLVARYR